MNAPSLLLVLLSGGFHATWNLLAKESRDKPAFFAGMLLTSTVLALPAFAYLYLKLGVTPSGWGYLATSGAFNAAYFISLGKAYERGDLSLVYPLARGFAPIIIPGLAWAWLGESISGLGALGIAVVCLGIYTLHLRSFSPGDLADPLRAWRTPASHYALATGLFTALYSVVDKRGVALVHPFLYIYVMFLLSGSLVALSAIRGGKKSLVEEWRHSPWRMAAAGALCMLGYLLILVALTMSKVSYVASARSINIVLGTALGSALLREPYGRMRLAGAFLIVLGVVLISLAK